MNHYKKHLAIAFILCFVGFFIAQPLMPLVMHYVNPSQTEFVMISPGEPFSEIVCFYFYFALFIAALYLLNAWQRNQKNFKLHFLVSIIFSAVVIFVVMHYYRLQVLQFDQLMTEVSKRVPYLSRSFSFPDISMIPLAGLVFIVLYFCFRVYFVTSIRFVTKIFDE